jgi:hypothetical protein
MSDETKRGWEKRLRDLEAEMCRALPPDDVSTPLAVAYARTYEAWRALYDERTAAEREVRMAQYAAEAEAEASRAAGAAADGYVIGPDGQVYPAPADDALALAEGT